jgi:hypothetical protein
MLAKKNKDMEVEKYKRISEGDTDYPQINKYIPDLERFISETCDVEYFPQHACLV